MNVGDLRAYVRGQIDMDETDLPDSLLNVYLQEAFDRTIAMLYDWPVTQKTWALTKVIGDDFLAIPSDMDVPGILSVSAEATGARLNYIDHGNAELAWSPLNTLAMPGVPAYFSVWGDQMFFWPPVATTQEYPVVVRGYRKPVWTTGTADVPDIDPRLHVTLAYFALSLAYAKEEDEVMEGIYLARWNRDMTQQIKQIRRPTRGQPLIYGGDPRWGQASSYLIVPPELP